MPREDLARPARLERSAWEESKARYEQTVLTALAEVSDALGGGWNLGASWLPKP